MSSGDRRSARRERPPLSRRVVLTAAAGAVGLLAGCGGPPSDSTGVPFVGTPVTVPPEGDPGRWRGRTVRVAAFGGPVEAALRAHVWEPFAAATGCDVVPVRGDGLDFFATPGAMVGPDLRLSDPVSAAALTAADVVPFRSDLVPTGIDGGESADPTTLPAFAYALANVRRRGAFPAGTEPVGWSAWWDVVRFPAARTLGRNPLGTLEAALLADGVAANQLYPLDVERALVALDRVSATIGDRWWTRGIEPVGWIGDGGADLGSAWHHRVYAAQWDGLAVELSWPGGLLAVDRWFVPANAREPEIAAELAAHSLRPEAQAALARETRLGPVNPEAFAFVEPWLRPTIPTAPEIAPQLVPLDGAWWANSGAETRDRFDRWFASRPLT